MAQYMLYTTLYPWNPDYVLLIKPYLLLVLKVYILLHTLRIRDLIAGARGADIATSSSQNEELVNDLNLKSQADIGYNLMIREATWYNGSNLAQTIYTCRYLPEQERLVQFLLMHNLEPPSGRSLCGQRFSMTDIPLD